MKLTLSLRYANDYANERPLTNIVWDSEAGTVTGPDAFEVRARLDSAIEVGSVTIDPIPTGYDISDPYHRPDEFAAVLSTRWLLTTELRALYPDIPEIDMEEFSENVRDRILF